MQVMMERNRESPSRRMGPARRCLSRRRAKWGQARAGGARQDFRRLPSRPIEQGHPLRIEAHRRRGLPSQRNRRLGAATPRHRHSGRHPMGWPAFMASPQRAAFMSRWWWAAEEPLSSAQSFRWVNTILDATSRTPVRGTYQAIRPKYAQRYLSEFEYRFNRRFDLPDIIPRLVYVALRTPPMPEKLLKLRLA